MSTPDPNESADRRKIVPSNAVTRGAAIGTPINILQSFVVIKLATKYDIPLDVAAAGIALLAQGISSGISYFSHGGRKGEPQ